MLRFIASSSPTTLAAALANSVSITVEAEFGDVFVPGSVLTMAHHGPRAGGKCPAAYTAADIVAAVTAVDCCQACQGCEAGTGCVSWWSGRTPLAVEVVGLSHFDLDTLGGCLAVLHASGEGFKRTNTPTAAAFWRLAEFVDVRGPHRLAESADAGDAEALAALHAFWAWGAANRGPRIPADGVVSMTDHVREAARIVNVLLAPWPNSDAWDDASLAYQKQEAEEKARLVEAGVAFIAAENALRVSSLVRQEGAVCLRSHGGFTNHLYAPLPGAAVIAYNPQMGSVTVSFADGSESPHSAVDIVQSLWGQLAGGHRGIAGSPRGQVMTMADAEAAFALVCDIANQGASRLAVVHTVDNAFVPPQGHGCR